MLPDTVAYDAGELVIIDQTLLPGELRLLRLSDAQSICGAIKRLAVRGAPAIGVAAAIGLAVCSKNMADGDLCGELKKTAELLAGARPTAVNLRWAIERVMRAAEKFELPEQKRAALLREALKIRDEDVASCRAIGENGLKLLGDGARILTHCNAGRLAAVRYGTALAPIYLGLERKMSFTVYCDETRPLLQGMRLSAYELSRAGADTRILCDNMVAWAMSEGRIDAVLVGADRIAANGDTANKIGTLGVAVLARHFKISFYVCAPLSTFDHETKTGAEIVIEQRDPSEVTRLAFGRELAPAQAKAQCPAFDVTPAQLVSAWITEKGICYSAPF